MSAFGLDPDAPPPAAAVPLTPITEYPPQKAWSHSAVKQHKNCARVIRYRRIDRLPEPKGPHLERGIDVHAAIEKYILGELDFPDFLDPTWLPLMQSMRERKVQVECEIAVTKDWSIAPDWFHSTVWGRVAFDTFERVQATPQREPHVIIHDWKTGKVYAEDHAEQAKLYAFVAFRVDPVPTAVDVRFGYVDRPLVAPLHSHVFVRDQLDEMQEWFDGFIHDFFLDTWYPASPSWRCNNCHFRRSNGGPCEHG